MYLAEVGLDTEIDEEVIQTLCYLVRKLLFMMMHDIRGAGFIVQGRAHSLKSMAFVDRLMALVDFFFLFL